MYESNIGVTCQKDGNGGPWLPGFTPDLILAAGKAARARNCFFTTRDARAAHDQMNAAFWPHEWRCAKGGNDFECTHFWLDLPSSRINMVQYSHDVWVETPPNRQAVVLQFSANGHCRISQGGPMHEIGPSEFYIASPDRPFRQYLPAGYFQLTVSARMDVVRRHLLRATGDVPTNLQLTDRPVSIAGRGESLIGLFSHLLWQSSLDDPVSNCSAVASALDQAVIAGMLYALPGDHQAMMHKPTTISALPYYVRRADQYIREHADKTIILEEVVAVAGVSARTLHYGFNRFLDCSPMAYVKQVRLKMARERLLAAGAHGGSVTQIAMECGFSHLSKFARDYRLRFGEPPSETLRRALQ